MKWNINFKRTILSVFFCFIFGIGERYLCADWQLWHVISRFIWIVITHCINEYTVHQTARIIWKLITVCRLVLSVLVFGGILTIIKMVFLVHHDIIDIANISYVYSHSTLYHILLILFQVSHMKSFCYSLVMLHETCFGESYRSSNPFLDSMKRLFKSTIPYLCLLFVVMLCPPVHIMLWLFGIRLYGMVDSILSYTLDLIPAISNVIEELKRNIWMLCDFILTGLCVVRFVYFGIYIAPWMLVPFIIVRVISKLNGMFGLSYRFA